MKANLRPTLIEMKNMEEEAFKKHIGELAERVQKLEKELAAELETTLESQRVKDLQKQLEEAQESLPQGIKDLRKNLDETIRELQRAMKARDQAMMERQRRQESEALARFRADQQQRDAEAARQQKRRRDPSQPFKLEPGDIVNIAVEPEDKSLLRSGRIVVEHGGTLPLGPKLGRVQVTGKTLEEAESLVIKVLEEELREPHVQLTYGGRSVDGTTNPESPALESLRQEIEELRQTIRDLRSGKLPPQVVPTERK
jgi:hypothetical protein